MNESYKCKNCGRVFGKRQSLTGHLLWCGRDTSEHRRKLSEAGRNRLPISTETREKLSKAARGKSPSIETRRKMSEALSGSKHPNYNKHRSAEIRQKLSESHQGKHPSAETRQKLSEAKRGAKHPRWRGGHFLYGPTWPLQRIRARTRDSFTCQRCGITEEQLGHEISVHHIQRFRESKDSTLDNLICLCDVADNGCHYYCEQHPEECPEPRKHWLLNAHNQ